MVLDLKDLSPSFVTRERGDQAADALIQESVGLKASEPIYVTFDEGSLISVSFIDQLLQKIHEKVSQRLIWVLPKGKDTELYDKLSRFVGLRKIDVEYSASLKGSIEKVSPRSILTFANIEFENKPKQDN